ncbi:serine/threonine-protein kinase [Nostoc sp. JL23]|uniref:serine/threonine-protein kinase n=1 Tax=Nostoc sp. JL23 TaxID=2815394 RepID=UPI001DE3BC8F|nr:serine/threonine-protein kinase [Nostoc sp. JL23]MBN3878706.1 serine/threonine protein kinase [Nostoc sp. JL23]
MCSGFPHTDKSPQPLEKNSDSGFSQSNNLLNERYRILKPLGQGGFGKTFLSIDEKYPKHQQSSGYSATRLCVIKQFCPQSQTIYHNQKASDLFQQESLRLAQLGKHSQIPQLLDTFEEDGKQYLVQEWVDGQTLEQELAQAGAFSEAEIRQLLDDLLPVLQFVHAHQVIHRDIKSANIIRCQRNSQRQLFIVDFGAAKHITGGWEHTGTLIGSAEYAAPEQIRGKATFASDLYSLGVTCLHLLTQMSPFDLYDCSEDAWIWRSYLVEPISPSLEKILCKLVQPATRLRYQSVAEVFLDLNSLPKRSDGLSKPSTDTDIDDDNFETPYFGLMHEADLVASVTSFADSSVASVTMFDPKTRTWHYLPAKTEGAELARKVAAFLAPRLAAAAATLPVREKIFPVVSKETTHKSNKMHQIVLTAIASTIVSLAWAMETNSNYHNLKVELVKTFQEFFDAGRK